MDPFEELIKSLGIRMEILLKVDPHQACRLEFLDGYAVQIDLHSDADFLLIGTELGVLNPGPYREKIFREALKQNGNLEVPAGILAFSEKKEELILFELLPIASLTGDLLFTFLESFVALAKDWIHALRRGDVPEILEKTTSSGSGFFGLKP